MASQLPVSRLPAPSTIAVAKATSGPSPPTPSMSVSQISEIGSTNQLTSGTPAAGPAENPLQGLELGFRVEVSGNRRGIVRFMGPTEFAKGFWVGVELEEAKGRNDGSVNGVRYFQTQTNFGLFAPADKVKVLGSSQQPNSAASTSRRTSTSAMNAPQPLLLASQTRKSSMQTPRLPVSSGLRSRADSQESVNSISSNVSSASRTRPRLGVTALDRNVTEDEHDSALSDEVMMIHDPRWRSTVAHLQKAAPATPAATSTRRATPPANSSGANSPMMPSNTENLAILQRVLKEKEEHVEQLLKERDSERSEVARTALRAEQTEVELEKALRSLELLQEELRLQKERECELLKDKEEDEIKLLEERQKVEDLQFQMAEKNIDSTSLKSRAEEDESRLFDLQEELNEERSSRENLERQLAAAKLKYDEEMKTLQTTLCGMEDQLREWKDKYEQVNSKSMETAVVKESKAVELDVLQKEVQSLQGALEEKNKALEELHHEHDAMKSHEATLQQTKTQLSQQVNQMQQQNEELQKQVETLHASERDLRYQLGLSQSRADQLQEAKTRLEREHQELMDSMGGSSEQVNALQHQLKERTEALSRSQDELVVVQQKCEQLHHDVEESQARLVDLQSAHKEQTVQLDSQRMELNTVQEMLKTQQEEHARIVAEMKRNLVNVEEEWNKKLQSMRSELLAQHQTKEENMSGDLHKLQAEVESLQTATADCKQQIVLLEQDKCRLTADNDTHLHTMKQLREQVQQLQSEVDQVTQSRSATQSEKQLVQKNLVETLAKLDEAHIRLDVISREKLDLTELVAKLKNDISGLQLVEANNNTALLEKVTVLEEALRQAQQASLSQQELLQSVEGENANLQAELKAVKDSLQKQQETLTKEQEKLNSQLQVAFQEKSQMADELSTLRLEQELLHQNYNLSEEKVQQLKRELEEVSGEHTNTVNRLRKEKLQLEDQLKEAQRELHQSQKSAAAAAADSPPIEGKGDHVTSTFLNAIIAEQYAKIHDLERKIDLLTSVDLSPMEQKEALRKYTERVYCEQCEVFDSHDTSECPKFVASNGHTNTNLQQRMQRKASQQMSQRVYCDVCQVFDMHNTEECDRSSPPPTAYCAVCNSFGHTMSECPDDNTF